MNETIDLSMLVADLFFISHHIELIFIYLHFSFPSFFSTYLAAWVPVNRFKYSNNILSEERHRPLDYLYSIYFHNHRISVRSRTEHLAAYVGRALCQFSIVFVADV